MYQFDFRNANPDPNWIYYYSDFSGLDPTAPIPLYLFNFNTKFWLGVLQAIIIIGSAILQIYFSLDYGIRKTYMWVIAMITIFVLDFTVAETINLIIRSFVSRVILKIPDTQRFCNDIVNVYVLDQVPYANRYNVTNLLCRDMFTPMCRIVRKVSGDSLNTCAQINQVKVSFRLYKLKKWHMLHWQYRLKTLFSFCCYF